MTHSTDIVAYTYQADTHCPSCVLKIANAALVADGVKVPYLVVEDALNAWAVSARINRMDEHTFDSDVFPKVVFDSQCESPEVCGTCWEVINGECGRAGDGIDCFGPITLRTSRSGLTTSVICERHKADLEASLDDIQTRYPEVLHPDGCGCWGCSDGSY